MSADRSKPAGALCGHCGRWLWDHSDHAATCRLQPIEHAPRDGRTLIVADADGDWTAAAYWAGDMWALGHKDDGRAPVQIEFEPALFALPTAS